MGKHPGVVGSGLLLVAALLAACGSSTPSLAAGAGHTPAATEPPAQAPGAARTVPPATQSPGPVPNPSFPLSVTVARFGTLTAQTAANASCSATGRLPSGAPIATNGLGPKSASSGGLVSWSFAAATTERGTGSYTLTCAAGGSQRTVTAAYTIQ